jgi:hypothetical protein
LELGCIGKSPITEDAVLLEAWGLSEAHGKAEESLLNHKS